MSDVVVKIAFPIRPLVPFYILLRAHSEGMLKQRFKKYEGSLIKTILETLFGGIIANRREVQISREHPEYPIAPVIGCYVWGFVIVMLRGEPIGHPDAMRDLLKEQPLLPPHLQRSDLFNDCNVCTFDGRVRFVDYGDPLASEVLPLLSMSRH
ncbi:MAG: hypothetical protein PHV99_01130 [Candidatus Pacebacteria bacterium]|nr:hypothetical protein [Candidatus Paceibacterota bacterium]